MTPDNSVLHWLINLWPIILALVFLIANAVLLNSKVNRTFNSDGEPNYVTKTECEKKETTIKNEITKAMDWKKALYHEDGSLNYITRKEFDRTMDEMHNDNGQNMTYKDHEKICKIASLEIAQQVGIMMDARFSTFETKLLKALKLNGFSRPSEV